MSQLGTVTGLVALLVHTVPPICLVAGGTLPLSPGKYKKFLSSYWSAGVVLEAAFQPRCSGILIHDAKNLPSIDFIGIGQQWAPWGVALFEVAVDRWDANLTQTEISLAVTKAQRLRQVSACVTVVVVSDDITFLTAFAECSLKVRLLVWSTRLLAITSLHLLQLQHLLRSYWTFSMMNAMFVVLNEKSNLHSMYVNLPYSVSGAKIVEIGVWRKVRGLQLLNLPLFPEKFNNFYGATVNVTALPYKPFWSVTKEQSDNNPGDCRYTGSDAMMLCAIAGTLNFTINVLPVATWDQVTSLVMERSSFMAAVTYMVLPQRCLLYDFTYVYIQGSISFAMATPSFISNWESLVDPLTTEVWVAIFVVLLMVPPCLFMISRPEDGARLNDRLTIGESTEIAVGTLLGQGTKKQLPESSSSRLLLVSWLVFAFIVSNVYRGNLTAALTLPKYPPRPETLEHLIKVVDKVTMPTFGEKFQQFFEQSDSEVYQTLSGIMEFVTFAADGLRQAAEKKQAYIDGQRYLQQVIADNFTLADGSTQLYIGRESIFPGPNAWPIPHDAPYKPQLDKLMMYSVEAGLYEKWINDMILKAKDDSRRREREELEAGLVVAAQSAPDTSGNQALTLHHMQGPLMIVAMGLSSSMIVFITELLLKLYKKGTA